jgi:hypothetical protein
MEQTHDTVGPGPDVLSIAAGEPTEDPAPRPVTPGSRRRLPMSGTETSRTRSPVRSRRLVPSRELHIRPLLTRLETDEDRLAEHGAGIGNKLSIKLYRLCRVFFPRPPLSDSE